MFVDSLIPWVASSSTTMALTTQDRWFPVFHKEGFQIFLAFQCWRMIGIPKIYCVSWIKYSKRGAKSTPEYIQTEREASPPFLSTCYIRATCTQICPHSLCIFFFIHSSLSASFHSTSFSETALCTHSVCAVHLANVSPGLIITHCARTLVDGVMTLKCNIRKNYIDSDHAHLLGNWS